MPSRIAVALVATLLLAPSVGAHTAQEPLPVETQVLQDEGRDEFFYYDGYDLWTLFVREAYNFTRSVGGLAFRFTLYGGFGPVNRSEKLHIDVGLDAANTSRSWRISTPDDRTWSGNMSVIHTNITEAGRTYPGVTAHIQTFVSYDRLGAEPDDSVSAFRMRSLAGDDLRDVAPGGFFVPDSGGRAEIPSDSKRLVEALQLDGPVGYLDINATTRDGTVVFQVTNPFEEQGQHVIVRPSRAPAWSVESRGRLVANLPAGETARFRVDATPTANASQPVPVEFVTDVGGHQMRYVGVDGGELTVGPTAEDVAVAPPTAGAKTPGPGLVLAAAAVAAALILRRRHGTSEDRS